MEVLRANRWEVTLVTLLHGSALQVEHYPAVKALGVNVVMMSGATVLTTRGELRAALDTLPPVSLFYIVQTFRSNQIVSPVAILKPFLINTQLVTLNTDMQSIRTVSHNAKVEKKQVNSKGRKEIVRLTNDLTLSLSITTPLFEPCSTCSTRPRRHSLMPFRCRTFKNGGRTIGSPQ